jgi:hypothetical protein
MHTSGKAACISEETSAAVEPWMPCRVSAMVPSRLGTPHMSFALRATTSRLGPCEFPASSTCSPTTSTGTLSLAPPTCVISLYVNLNWLKQRGENSQALEARTVCDDRQAQSAALL